LELVYGSERVVIVWEDIGNAESMTFFCFDVGREVSNEFVAARAEGFMVIYKGGEINLR
jgi:hypothetical protein